MINAIMRKTDLNIHKPREGMLASIKSLGEHIDKHMERGEYFAALAVAQQQSRTIKELIKRETNKGD